MPTPDDFLHTVKEVGGVFKFGTGVLGKSAIALGVLLIAVIVAVARLHSDGAIIAVIIIGAALFFGWFAYVLRFAGDHPDAALLEGAEWSSYHKFQAAAKGYTPTQAEQQPVLAPGSNLQLIAERTNSKESDEGQEEK
jgi:hypothetical protein